MAYPLRKVAARNRKRVAGLADGRQALLDLRARDRAASAHYQCTCDGGRVM